MTKPISSLWEGKLPPKALHKLLSLKGEERLDYLDGLIKVYEDSLSDVASHITPESRKWGDRQVKHFDLLVCGLRKYRKLYADRIARSTTCHPHSQAHAPVQSQN